MQPVPDSTGDNRVKLSLTCTAGFTSLTKKSSTKQESTVKRFVPKRTFNIHYLPYVSGNNRIKLLVSAVFAGCRTDVHRIAATTPASAGPQREPTSPPPGPNNTALLSIPSRYLVQAASWSVRLIKPTRSPNHYRRQHSQAFQTWPGLVRTPAIAFRVSTTQEDQSASSW